MSAIPSSAPIANLRNGGITPPWVQWLTLLQSQIGGSSPGNTDTDARQQAADAETLASQAIAYFAALEKRVADLEVQTLGNVR